MSHGSNFFSQRDEVTICPFRLGIIPNFGSTSHPIMHLPIPSFKQAVEQKIIMGHTLLYLSKEKLMHEYPNAFFIERFDTQTQEWVVIDDEDSPAEHGLPFDAASVSDYVDYLTEQFFTQRGLM